MALVSQDKKKKRGLKSLKAGVKYSVDGLKYAYKNEQSMTLHLFTCIIFFTLAIIFKVELLELTISIMLLGLIAATELINTSLEAVVDLVTQERHPIAKVAKDTASAAVFILSSAAFISFLIIFVPEIIKVLS